MRSFVTKVLMTLGTISTALVVGTVLVIGGRELAPKLKPAISSPETSATTADASPEATPTPDSDKNSASEGQSTPEQPASEPALVDEQPSKPKALPLDKVDKSIQPAYLQIQSNPPGARVEVGLQFTDWNIIPGTGRRACITPCVVRIDPTDVAILPNGAANLIIRLDKGNFASHLDIVNLGKIDRGDALAPGKTYHRSVTLQHSSWFQGTSENKELTWDTDS